MATSCLGGVGNWVGALIISQFNYLYCFSDNITNLENEAENLNVLERDLQGKVRAARDDVRVITDEVQTWLKNSNKIKDEINGILNEVPNVESGCLKLGARFFLSRRAKKTTDRVKELRGRSNFQADDISQPAPAAATQPIPSGIKDEFESRKQIEEDIMATLRRRDVNMMGICGMGGLGKTTMAKRIKNRALEEHVFEEVAMVVVSRPIDKSKVQLEIGGSLGLKLEGEYSEARVQKLHARLSSTKRILLILDDVWERFKPEDLGIPRGSKGCTILLTSRNRDVLTAMNVEKIFGMEVLSEEDSWLLFRMGAGQCVDDIKLNSIAKEVVSECAGLPIVLITVGAALNGAHVSIWENALQRLKINCTPDIPEYIAEVYNPLKLSYDVLERKYQDVFLLCCLYPEDAHIPLEQLTYFCMGLRLLEGAIGNVEAARNRIRALTNVLKNRSLLLDSEEGDDFVRMHDVVRDVCVFIAKHEGYIGDNDLTSSLQRYKLHSGFELLQIRNSDEEINFHGITNLHVLSIEWCSQLTSLPFTQRPNNLITLVLDSCEGLETLSVVGELVNLEILICRDCYSVKCELGECESMKKVVTSSMDKGGATVFPSIEHLLLFNLPKLVEICDDRISSNSFQNLKILKLLDLPVLKQLWMSSQNDLGKDFLPQLEVLFIRDCGMMETVFLWKGEDGNENTSCHHITKSFPKLQELKLNRLPNLISLCEGIGGIEFPLMRKIKIEDCGKMKGMVWNEEISGGSSNNASIHALFFPQEVSFGCLKALYYDRNPFCSHTIHVSVFDRLEVLIIDGYKGSMSLFSSSITGNLVNLTTLTIWKCDKMVKAIEEKEEEKEKVVSGVQRTTILFPKLQEIALWHLPELVRFCEWKCDVELPSLTEVVIYKCDNMKSFTLGHLNTPKLESVEIKLQDFGAVKDLNAFLQQQYFNRTEEKQAEEAEKKKGGEEEQERKGETEEEQN